jgi:hypothetical protein
MQLADCFDKPGDAREVTIGQQTLDADGAPPLRHNNAGHSGQSEELGAVSPLVAGRSGLSGLAHRCIISCQPRQQGEWVEGREVYCSR